MLDNIDLRRLSYRLNRQGMLELDAWLLPVKEALLHGDEVLLAEVELLVAMDTPDLLALMHGEKPLPEVLKSWLEA